MLHDKIEVATILGTIQATLTDFGYLRKRWQRNTEEERLLGVSLTGIMDNSLLSRMRTNFTRSITKYETQSCNSK